MNQTIRKRIEDIKNGIVPEGYKKTKVGIVPIEWEESRLSKYLVLNNEKNKECKYLREDVFSISGEQGVVNQIKHMGRSYAGESLDNYSVVYPMDIVYTKSPLKDNPYGIIKTNLTGTTGIVSVLYAVYKPKENVVPKYVQYYFENDIVLNNYLLPIVEIGPKHTMNIGDKQSLQGVVAFATKKEQEKITEILSEHDILIKLKEKLIEQKKQQKKYLMQQLLTGRTRLFNYLEKWQKKELKNVAQIIAGATPDTKIKEYWDGNVRWMNSGELNGKKIFEVEGRITECALKNTAVKLLPTKCVLVGLAGQGKTRGTVAINYVALCTNQSVAAILPNDKYFVPEFLYYKLDSLYFYLRKISSGDTTRGGLNLKLLGEIRILFPSIKEQQAIVNILSQADKEIELLQKDLEEEKNKKKALMQLLLTGIVRVS